ncbi:MAG: bifunctional glutamate N-acetyltransferase/amino-acid acetyltransferase ArgJ [Spirochaetes bacterium]|nr:bifunctional glutamate N-acetyltransferase/amino-acid acetyltransferase ArgJ [Spirochaetota bacterium]
MKKKKIKIKEIAGGVTAPLGFLTSGVHCGLRRSKYDIALIYSKEKCLAVGGFTKNLLQAAPLIISRKHIKGPIKAVIVNSGNANAATGKKGLADARTMCRLTAQNLNIKTENVLVFSTGVIGKFMDMAKISKGIKMLIPVLNTSSEEAAEAILTTDRVKKQVVTEFKIKNKKVRIGGMAKGSGMIAPNMATMLAFICSDVNIKKSLLNKLFQHALERSFNLISIDGEMSTNDACVFMTNKKAGNDEINEKTADSIKIFYANLLYVMQKLARMIVSDGEGVTKLIEIKVINCKTKKKARAIASRIANSPLVKTAIYGGDANWGRVASSIGASGEKVNMEKCIIKFGNYLMYRNNAPVKFSEEKLAAYLKNKKIQILVDLQEGKEAISFFTGDLTEEYIRINAHYRS